MQNQTNPNVTIPNVTSCCTVCADDVPPARAALQKHNKEAITCLRCGEARAIQKRNTWCVIQTYGKGGYQFVTNESAPLMLKQTNQKQIRS
jgi:hypothetical protein